jgi:hypothetical protein
MDVEEFGASRWRKGFEPLAECVLHLLEGHAAHASASD